eukprot:g2069.t1
MSNSRSSAYPQHYHSLRHRRALQDDVLTSVTLHATGQFALLAYLHPLPLPPTRYHARYLNSNRGTSGTDASAASKRNKTIKMGPRHRFERKVLLVNIGNDTTSDKGDDEEEDDDNNTPNGATGSLNAYLSQPIGSLGGVTRKHKFAPETVDFSNYFPRPAVLDSTLRFNPHQSHGPYVASTSGLTDIVQVFNIQVSITKPTHTCDPTRQIQNDPYRITKVRVRDVQWSPDNPSILSTILSNNTVQIWDLRSAKNKARATLRIKSRQTPVGYYSDNYNYGNSIGTHHHHTYTAMGFNSSSLSSLHGKGTQFRFAMHAPPSSATYYNPTLTVDMYNRYGAGTRSARFGQNTAGAGSGGNLGALGHFNRKRKQALADGVTTGSDQNDTEWRGPRTSLSIMMENSDDLRGEEGQNKSMINDGNNSRINGSNNPRINPNHQSLLRSTSHNNDIHIGEACLPVASPHYHNLAWNTANTFILASSHDDIAVLWDIRMEHSVIGNSNSAPTSSMESNDELFSTTTSNNLSSSSVSSGILASFCAHEGIITSMSWDSHSGCLATASSDSLIKVWRIDLSEHIMEKEKEKVETGYHHDENEDYERENKNDDSGEIRKDTLDKTRSRNERNKVMKEKEIIGAGAGAAGGAHMTIIMNHQSLQAMVTLKGIVYTGYPVSHISFVPEDIKSSIDDQVGEKTRTPTLTLTKTTTSRIARMKNDKDNDVKNNYQSNNSKTNISNHKTFSALLSSASHQRDRTLKLWDTGAIIQSYEDQKREEEIQIAEGLEPETIAETNRREAQIIEGATIDAVELLDGLAITPDNEDGMIKDDDDDDNDEDADDFIDELHDEDLEDEDLEDEALEHINENDLGHQLSKQNQKDRIRSNGGAMRDLIRSNGGAMRDLIRSTGGAVVAVGNSSGMIQLRSSSSENMKTRNLVVKSATTFSKSTHEREKRRAQATNTVTVSDGDNRGMMSIGNKQQEEEDHENETSQEEDEEEDELDLELDDEMQEIDGILLQSGGRILSDQDVQNMIFGERAKQSYRKALVGTYEGHKDIILGFAFLRKEKKKKNSQGKAAVISGSGSGSTGSEMETPKEENDNGKREANNTVTAEANVVHETILVAETVVSWSGGTNGALLLQDLENSHFEKLDKRRKRRERKRKRIIMEQQKLLHDEENQLNMLNDSSDPSKIRIEKGIRRNGLIKQRRTLTTLTNVSSRGNSSSLLPNSSKNNTRNSTETDITRLDGTHLGVSGGGGGAPGGASTALLSSRRIQENHTALGVFSSTSSRRAALLLSRNGTEKNPIFTSDFLNLKNIQKDVFSFYGKGNNEKSNFIMEKNNQKMVFNSFSFGEDQSLLSFTSSSSSSDDGFVSSVESMSSSDEDEQQETMEKQDIAKTNELSVKDETTLDNDNTPSNRPDESALDSNPMKLENHDMIVNQKENDTETCTVKSKDINDEMNKEMGTEINKEKSTEMKKEKSTEINKEKSTETATETGTETATEMKSESGKATLTNDIINDPSKNTNPIKDIEKRNMNNQGTRGDQSGSEDEEKMDEDDIGLEIGNIGSRLDGETMNPLQELEEDEAIIVDPFIVPSPGMCRVSFAPNGSLIFLRCHHEEKVLNKNMGDNKNTYDNDRSPQQQSMTNNVSSSRSSRIRRDLLSQTPRPTLDNGNNDEISQVSYGLRFVPTLLQISKSDHHTDDVSTTELGLLNHTTTNTAMKEKKRRRDNKDIKRMKEYYREKKKKKKKERKKNVFNNKKSLPQRRRPTSSTIITKKIKTSPQRYSYLLRSYGDLLEIMGLNDEGGGPGENQIETYFSSNSNNSLSSRSDNNDESRSNSESESTNFSEEEDESKNLLLDRQSSKQSDVSQDDGSESSASSGIMESELLQSHLSQDDDQGGIQFSDNDQNDHHDSTKSSLIDNDTTSTSSSENELDSTSDEFETTSDELTSNDDIADSEDGFHSDKSEKDQSMSFVEKEIPGEEEIPGEGNGDEEVREERLHNDNETPMENEAKSDDSETSESEDDIDMLDDFAIFRRHTMTTKVLSSSSTLNGIKGGLTSEGGSTSEGVTLSLSNELNTNEGAGTTTQQPQQQQTAILKPRMKRHNSALLAAVLDLRQADFFSQMSSKKDDQKKRRKNRTKKRENKEKRKGGNKQNNNKIKKKKKSNSAVKMNKLKKKEARQKKDKKLRSKRRWMKGKKRRNQKRRKGMGRTRRNDNEEEDSDERSIGTSSLNMNQNRLDFSKLTGIAVLLNTETLCGFRKSLVETYRYILPIVQDDDDEETKQIVSTEEKINQIVSKEKTNQSVGDIVQVIKNDKVIQSIANEICERNAALASLHQRSKSSESWRILGNAIGVMACKRRRRPRTVNRNDITTGRVHETVEGRKRIVIIGEKEIDVQRGNMKIIPVGIQLEKFPRSRMKKRLWQITRFSTSEQESRETQAGILLTIAQQIYREHLLMGNIQFLSYFSTVVACFLVVFLGNESLPLHLPLKKKQKRTNSVLSQTLPMAWDMFNILESDDNNTPAIDNNPHEGISNAANIAVWLLIDAPRVIWRYTKYIRTLGYNIEAQNLLQIFGQAHTYLFHTHTKGRVRQSAIEKMWGLDASLYFHNVVAPLASKAIVNRDTTNENSGIKKGNDDNEDRVMFWVKRSLVHTVVTADIWSACFIGSVSRNFVQQDVVVNASSQSVKQ